MVALGCASTRAAKRAKSTGHRAKSESRPVFDAFCFLPFAICFLPFALCPLPFALCPLPFALCPLPFALCPYTLLTFNHRQLPRHRLVERGDLLVDDIHECRSGGGELLLELVENLVGGV